MRTRALIALVTMTLGCGASTESPGPVAPEEEVREEPTPPAAQPAAETKSTPPAEASPAPGEQAARSAEDTASADACREELDNLVKSGADRAPPGDYVRIAGCFERAGFPGQQLRLLDQVVRLFPESDAARVALRDSGEVYEEMGFLNRAAVAYEQYGLRDGGEDGRAALRRAICLQYILDRERAEDNARRLASMQGRSAGQAHQAPAERCPDALNTVNEAICSLHARGRERTDEKAQKLADLRAERFDRGYAAPEALCPDDRDGR